MFYSRKRPLRATGRNQLEMLWDKGNFYIIYISSNSAESASNCWIVFIPYLKGSYWELSKWINQWLLADIRSIVVNINCSDIISNSFFFLCSYFQLIFYLFISDFSRSSGRLNGSLHQLWQTSAGLFFASILTCVCAQRDEEHLCL